MDRKNLLKAGRRSSLSLNASTRSLNASRSQAVAETAAFCLERHGASLPVAVIELLSSRERRSECSAALSADGWAWFVSGRHLVVWNYASAPRAAAGVRPSTVSHKARPTPRSYELTLPASDLAHKAGLVTVLAGQEEGGPPACLAVSPEGTVRYWSSAAQEAAFVELRAADRLRGEECDALVVSQPPSCLVATTTATVLLLTPRLVDGRPAIECRPLRPTHGLLGSLGRRMSTLIFGATPAQASPETRLVKLVTARRSPDAELVDVHLLCSQQLQYWQVGDGLERLVCHVDVDKLARESFITHVWSRDSISIHQLRIWMLDAQVQAGDLVLLVAAANPNMGHGQVQVQYALATLSADALAGAGAGAVSFASFCVLKFATSLPTNVLATGEFGGLEPAVRFLVAGASAYVYGDTWILCVPCNEPLEEPERVEVRGPNERLLGAGVVVTDAQHGQPPQRPVFFSTRHGVLMLNPSSSTSADDQPSFLDDSLAVLHDVSLASEADVSVHVQVGVGGAGAGDPTAPMAPASASASASKLKSAFFHFCRKNVFEAQALLDELAAASAAHKNDADCLMDRLVHELSLRIVDDYPASDPRWTDSVPAGHESAFATVSLLVLHQLEDKVKAHDLFLNFLRSMSVWSELTTISDTKATSRKIATAFAVLEHGEKLRSLLALRALHTPGSTLIDASVRRVLTEGRAADARLLQTNDKLTHQDLFYRRVSGLADFFPTYVDVVAEAAASAEAATKVRLLTAAADHVVAMLNAARDYRARHVELMDQCDATFEMLPWIAAPGGWSVRWAVQRLAKLTVEEGAAHCDDAALRCGLWSRAAQLCDLLLDALRTHLDSVDEPHVLQQARTEFVFLRSQLITLFVDGGQLERAAVLAEKYVDFGALLTVCDLDADVDAADARLNEYIDKMADQGFTEFACKWYMQRNQREKLLRLRRSEVTSFLAGHPDLLWVDQSERGVYGDAGRTLASLAEAQRDAAGHKKTLLSLAKLHLVLDRRLDAGSDDDDDADADGHSDADLHNLERVEMALQLLAHQEQLPAAVLDAYGLDVDSMKVLTPQQLVEMYSGEENALANELDFKKALDLLAFVDSADERRALRSQVWARAVLRDAWTQLDTDDVLNSISSTLFYRIVDFARSTGQDVGELLPNVEELLAAPQLAELADSAVFRFLLQAVYEHVRALANQDDGR